MKLYTKHVSPGGRTTYYEYPVTVISSALCCKCDFFINKDKDGVGVCDKHALLVHEHCHCLDFEPVQEDE